MEIHFDQKSIILDNYKSLKAFGCKVKSFDLSISNKGQYEELGEFVNAIKSGNWAIDWWDVKQTTATTFLLENTK